MCPICRAATSRLLCQVPAGGSRRTQLTIQTVTPLMHRCTDVDVEDSGRAVMMITGELDAYAASLVDEPCSDWLSTGGDAVIDLSNVTLIDAAGTTLVQRLRRAAPGAVRFRDPSRIVRRVFDILSVPIDIPPQADRDSLLAVEP